MTVTANRLIARDKITPAGKLGLVTAGAMTVHGDSISTVTSSIAMRVIAKTTNAPNLYVKMEIGKMTLDLRVTIGTKNIVKSMAGRLSKASVVTHFLPTKHAMFARVLILARLLLCNLKPQVLVLLTS